MVPITVAIPVRNRAGLLRATLRTVAAQTVRPSEVLVADDGSTDESAEVAERAGARVLRRPGGGWGAAGARNAALAAAAGGFIMFLDSDDLLLPTALERLAAALHPERDAPFAYGRALAAVCDTGGWQPVGLIAAERRELADPLVALFVRNAVPSPAALVRRAAAREVGGYDESLPFSEDQDFFIRLGLGGAPVHVPEIVAVHRRHAGNRHSDDAALASDLRISRLAERDGRLRARLPERGGVRLAELALDAVRTRQGQAFARHAPRLLLRSGSPPRTVRAAVRHVRARRSWARAGAALWAGDPDLRRWLAAQ